MFLAQTPKQELENTRRYTDKYFREIFELIKLFVIKMDIEIKMPRFSNRQTNRCNIHINVSEIYYRVLIFIPHIDKFISKSEERFTNRQIILSNFQSLFKENCYDEDFINIAK